MSACDGCVRQYNQDHKPYCDYYGPGGMLEIYADIATPDTSNSMKESTNMQLQSYNRNPFDPIKAIRVTNENMAEVADWCGGSIHTDPRGRFIDVPVSNPRNDRQKKAYPGDWVLSSKTGFKSYTDSAFHVHFSPVADVDDETSAQDEASGLAARPVPASNSTENQDALPVGDSVQSSGSYNIFSPLGVDASTLQSLRHVAERDAIAAQRLGK